MDFQDWLKSIPGSPNPTAAAKSSNLSAATLIRHVERGYSTADNIIAIARAYRINPVDALVDNGFLSPDEIGGERTAIKEALREAGIGEILEIIVERVNNSGLIEGKFETNFIADSVSDLDSRREAKSTVDTAEVDYDAIVDGINAGTERFAAQKTTEPLEEHFT